LRKDADSSVRDKHRLVASVIIVAAAVFVYRAAVLAYFFDDDFQWLVGTWAFHPAQLLDVAHLTHFYRPVIDLYFAHVKSFAAGTEEYRRYITLFKQAHGDLPSHSRVPFDPSLAGEERYRFMNALVQWEYRDPTIGLIPHQPNPR
jgi:hypothetical protein